MPPRLKEQFRDTVAGKASETFKITNPMALPRLEKIVVNTCLKEAITNMKILETAAAEIGTITGQKPIIRRARRSIANFKLREGMPLGAKVTLRADRMWEFLDRLINLAIPRIRDFRGFSTRAFDGSGNYSLGLAEQMVFPEINIDEVEFVQGLNINITMDRSTDEASQALLELLGFPFRK